MMVFTRGLLAMAPTENIRRLAEALKIRKAKKMPRAVLIDEVLRELALKAHLDFLRDPTPGKREVWIRQSVAAGVSLDDAWE